VFLGRLGDQFTFDISSRYLWFLIQSIPIEKVRGFLKGLEISLETKTRGEKSF